MLERSPSSRGWAIAIAGIFIASCFGAAAQARSHPPLTDVIVLVTDASSHKPIFQARLTLEFRDPQSRRGKMISFNAKTDLQGKYKFVFIPMEPVFLFVTDPSHQTFGRKFQIAQENQIIRVELRSPEPLR